MKKITGWLKNELETLAYGFFQRKVLDVASPHLDFRISGLENLTKDSAILVPNHEIGPDSILLASQLSPRIHYLVDNSIADLKRLDPNLSPYARAKKALIFTEMKALLWAVGQIPVGLDKGSSGKKVITRVGEYLMMNNGHIGIFSEGPAKNLMREGLPIPVQERAHQPGAAYFATKYNRPIIPIALATTEEMVAKFWHFPYAQKEELVAQAKEYIARRGKIPYVIEIGEPIFCPDRKILAERVRAKINEMYTAAKSKLN